MPRRSELRRACPQASSTAGAARGSSRAWSEEGLLIESRSRLQNVLPLPCLAHRRSSSRDDASLTRDDCVLFIASFVGRALIVKHVHCRW